MKTCKWCKQIKEFDHFYERLGMKDGHLNKCKECLKECRIQYQLKLSKRELENGIKKRSKRKRTSSPL